MPPLAPTSTSVKGSSGPIGGVITVGTTAECGLTFTDLSLPPVAAVALGWAEIGGRLSRGARLDHDLLQHDAWIDHPHLERVKTTVGQRVRRGDGARVI